MRRFPEYSLSNGVRHFYTFQQNKNRPPDAGTAVYRLTSVSLLCIHVSIEQKLGLPLGIHFDSIL